MMDTVDPGYTIISSVAGTGKAAENVLKAMYTFHNFLAELHGEDPGEIVITRKVAKVEWWYVQADQLALKQMISFKAKRKPGMHWYRQPNGAFFNTSPAGDVADMDVWNVLLVEDETWFLVYRGQNSNIWVKALETSSPT